MSAAVTERGPRKAASVARQASSTEVFEQHESNVRSYCRSFPTVFQRSKGAMLYDEACRGYIDFFAGAGALNYGHNPDVIRDRLIAYLRDDNVSHALDMFTVAKREFLTRFVDVILAPRGLDYKVQFTGPTGADAVEAALKLARLATGRQTMAAFTGGWHGMTAGCLQVTANRETRATAGVQLTHTTFLPYADGPLRFGDSLGHIRSLFDDASSGFEKPAAIIVETVQSEGGIYVAPVAWLRGLRELCDEHGVLLIVDDVQVGCGRTGQFFSFERAGIQPDIVCLSKSIGGYGLPMSLVLMRRGIDVWKRAQHTGTFRGNQLAFVAAAAALEHWETPAFSESIARKGEVVRAALGPLLAAHPAIVLRGIGLIHGVDLAQVGGGDVAAAVARRCFAEGLVIERSGRGDTVMKILPPLTIEDDVLAKGCRILVDAIAAELDAPRSRR